MKTRPSSLHPRQVLTVGLALLASLSAQADSSAAPHTMPETVHRAEPKELSHWDRAFLEKALHSGLKEIDISQAVQDRIADPQVKAVTEMMIADHLAANREITDLAASKNVTLAEPERKPVSKWLKKTKDLDDDYLKEMEDEHEDAVDLFEKAMKSDDPDIAKFAGHTLPALQHHLSMVKEARKALK